jgi:hypothetical protein
MIPTQTMDQYHFTCKDKVIYIYTFYETTPCPLNLCSDNNLGRSSARPHNTRPRLDGENASTGYVRCPRSGNSADVVLKITKDGFVFYLTFCLLGSEGRVEWFDVGHVAG